MRFVLSVLVLLWGTVFTNSATASTAMDMKINCFVEGVANAAVLANFFYRQNLEVLHDAGKINEALYNKASSL